MTNNKLFQEEILFSRFPKVKTGKMIKDCIVVYESIYNGNTEKLAGTMARGLNLEIAGVIKEGGKLYVALFNSEQ